MSGNIHSFLTAKRAFNTIGALRRICPSFNNISLIVYGNLSCKIKRYYMFHRCMVLARVSKLKVHTCLVNRVWYLISGKIQRYKFHKRCIKCACVKNKSKCFVKGAWYLLGVINNGTYIFHIMCMVPCLCIKYICVTWHQQVMSEHEFLTYKFHSSLRTFSVGHVS